MRKVWISVFGVSVGAFVAGCGGGDSGSGSGGGNTVSCVVAFNFGNLFGDAGAGGDAGSLNISSCTEYPNASSSTRSQLSNSCTTATVGAALGDGGAGAVTAMVDNGPCPRQNAAGGCQVTSGGVTAITWFYQPTFSASLVMSACMGTGTFVAP